MSSSFLARAAFAAAVFGVVGSCLDGPVLAHDPDAQVELPELKVEADRPLAASSQLLVPDKEYVLQPQGRPAQVLRLIPGLVAVEHSGGAGKADQYFLRGFDADHGTDVAFFTDGMPINFRSHAHGQGYTDLNFIIPETIDGVEASKGAYQVELGDFATAGAVNFRTREVVKESLAQAAGGLFGTQRYLLMFSPTKEQVRTLFAAEGYYTDGPFQNDNRYFRANLLGKLTMNPTGRSELSLTGTFHKAQWNGSGEIPQRAVDAGILDRFGAVDPSEGGKTIRSTGRVNFHHDTTTGGRFYANAYAQYYKFDLYSNFTFVLTDPVNGDGFQQSDRRLIYGGDVGFRQAGRWFDIDGSATLGLQSRVDDIHARLGPQVRRNPLGTTTDSDISEASYSPFFKVDLQLARWLRFSGGLRSEVFTFDVRNRCTSCTDQANGRTLSGLVLPKASLTLGPWGGTEFFANFGDGYHSNDARSAVSPGAVPLARARTYEVGTRSKPWGAEGLELTATLWTIHLKQELVFVGDDGTTEIRDATTRRGLEVAARGPLWGPLAFNGSMTWSRARFDTGERIANAPEVTAYAALLLRWPEGLSSQVQATYFGDRSLDENQKAPSWITVDLSERYQLPVRLSHGRLEAFLFVQNVLDTKWEQASFGFASRLAGEPAGGVSDQHFVPGNPRFVMAGLAWYF